MIRDILIAKQKLYYLILFRIAKDEDSGNIALSPVLKRHNAYLVHNETYYCDHHDEWRGIVDRFPRIVK